MSFVSKESRGVSQCRLIFHPWTSSCTLAALVSPVYVGLGCARLILPSYLLQLLLKLQKRKADRAYLKNHLIGFGRSVLFATSLCGVFLSTSCLLRSILGRYYRYSAVFFPTLFAAPSIFFERPFKRNLYAYTFFQMLLEYLVIILKTRGMRSMHPAKETLIFMVINSALLYLARTDKSKKPIYWFFLPKNNEQKDENDSPEKVNGNPCSHTDPCLRSMLKSSVKYAGIGVGIQVLQRVAKRFSEILRIPSMTLVSILWDKSILRLGTFFGLYVALYKSILCVLRRTCSGDEDVHTLIAGFLAGTAYWFNPDRTWALSAATMVVQLLLRRARSAGLLPDPPFLAELVFVICCPILFQVRFLDSPNCPRFIATTLATATNGRSEYIYNNFQTKAGEFLLRPTT